MESEVGAKVIETVMLILQIFGFFENENQGGSRVSWTGADPINLLGIKGSDLNKNTSYSELQSE